MNNAMLPLKLSRIKVAADLEMEIYEISDADALVENTLSGGGHNPYGGILWPSATHLARHLAHQLPAGGTGILELGAGVGLTSLVAARLGFSVLATDVDPNALELIRKNAEHNQIHLEVQTFDIFSGHALPPADLVVVADLLYEKSLAEKMAQRVKEAIGRGMEIRMTDPGRFSRTLFENWLAKEQGPIVFEALGDGVELFWHRGRGALP